MLKDRYSASKNNNAGHKNQWPAFIEGIHGFYKNRVKYFSLFHILTLLITGIVSTTITTQKYMYGKTHDTLINKYKKFENNSKFLRTYYRYTGTETGFGFFAPDVKSHGAMFFESCGTLLDLPFETNEGNIRKNCMVTNITDYIREEIEDNDKKITIEQIFSNLLIQNLVAKIRQVNGIDQGCKTINVTYKLVQFPPLEVAEHSRKPKLFDVKNWKYETKN